MVAPRAARQMLKSDYSRAIVPGHLRWLEVPGPQARESFAQAKYPKIKKLQSNPVKLSTLVL
jgi:hypothetical protein